MEELLKLNWKPNKKGKENAGRIIRFHKMFNTNRQAKPRANEEYWMWKTYYQAAGDNKHSAYVCLNAYLVVKNESCAKAVSFSLLLENV